MSASAKILIQWERPAVVADVEATDARATGDQSSTLATRLLGFVDHGMIGLIFLMS